MRWYFEGKKQWPDPVNPQFRPLSLGFPVYFRPFYPCAKIVFFGRRPGLLFASQYSPGHCISYPDHQKADRRQAQAALSCDFGNEYPDRTCRLDISCLACSQTVVAIHERPFKVNAE